MEQRPFVTLYLCGAAGSGKSTVAQILVGKHGFAALELSDVCRAECARRGWPMDRKHQQAAGDALRAFGTDDWLAKDAWHQAGRIAGPVVIAGVRLEAEADFLRRRGAFGVCVVSPAALCAARLAARDGASAVAPEAHRTEVEEPDYALAIWNTGTVAAMAAPLAAIVRQARIAHASALRGGAQIAADLDRILAGAARHGEMER